MKTLSVLSLSGLHFTTNVLMSINICKENAFLSGFLKAFLCPTFIPYLSFLSLSFAAATCFLGMTMMLLSQSLFRYVLFKQLQKKV
jgi:hypothetical protein